VDGGRGRGNSDVENRAARKPRCFFVADVKCSGTHSPQHFSRGLCLSVQGQETITAPYYSTGAMILTRTNP